MTPHPEAQTSESKANEAACNLARLMERQLGYVTGHIDPVALRLFLQVHWTKVSACAHAIHQETAP